MNKFDFEKLEVYQKSLNFINKIFNLFDNMPYRIQKSVGNNLLRASISIATNLAEGSGRRGRKEKRQFFIISQGSTFECIPMITILFKNKKISIETFKELYNDCYVISKMTGGLITRFSN